MADRKTRKGVGYIRVSRVAGRDRKNDGESFISPELQRERIQALATANGVRIVRWIEERDVSGKQEDRPGFQEAIQLVEDGAAHVIVCARMSRFARRVLHVERAVQRLEAVGGSFIASDLTTDQQSPQGRLMRTMLAAIAQFELEVHEEAWAEAKADRVARGMKLGRKPPPGYTWRQGGENHHQLVVDPVLAPVVLEVFQLRARGTSWRELGDFWAERTGQRISHTGSLRHMIQNRAYLGEIHHGELVNLTGHDPLPGMTPELWEAAQSRHVRAPRAGRNGGSLLAGILTCSSCGGKMSHDRGNRGKSRYLCIGRSRLGSCPQPLTVGAQIADPAVEQAFLTWAEGKAELEGTDDEGGYAQAVAALAKADAEVDAFTRVTEAAGNPERFAEQLAERMEAVDAAQEAVDTIRAAGKVETVRTDARQLWHNPATTLQEKRQMLAAALETCELHGLGGRSGRVVPFSERAVVTFRD